MSRREGATDPNVTAEVAARLPREREWLPGVPEAEREWRAQSFRRLGRPRG